MPSEMRMIEEKAGKVARAHVDALLTENWDAVMDAMKEAQAAALDDGKVPKFKVSLNVTMQRTGDGIAVKAKIGWGVRRGVDTMAEVASNQAELPLPGGEG